MTYFAGKLSSNLSVNSPGIWIEKGRRSGRFWSF